MFLLILSECCRQCGITLFTFHDVSINTTTRFYCLKLKFSLHSTMFLLIRWLNGTYNNTKKALHSTMFLLIQKQTQTDLWVFQTLHSTMFLLIHLRRTEWSVWLQSLHSTMFLLILDVKENNKYIISFTFHDVSINTFFNWFCFLFCFSFTFHDVSINTALLSFLIYPLFFLYIPRCFY